MVSISSIDPSSLILSMSLIEVATAFGVSARAQQRFNQNY
jgi:hypothetical protein